MERGGAPPIVPVRRRFEVKTNGFQYCLSAGVVLQHFRSPQIPPLPLGIYIYINIQILNLINLKWMIFGVINNLIF